MTYLYLVGYYCVRSTSERIVNDAVEAVLRVGRSGVSARGVVGGRRRPADMEAEDSRL